MNNNNKRTIVLALTGILTLSILAMTSISIVHVSAQKCQTHITLASYPKNGVVGFDSGTMGASLFGNLKCGDTAVVGAIITITGLDGEDIQVKTDNFGSYSTAARFNLGTWTVEAVYDGDNEHDPASATRTLTAHQSMPSGN